MSSIPDEDLAPDTNYGNAFPEDWFWLKEGTGLGKAPFDREAMRKTMLADIEADIAAAIESQQQNNN